MPWLDECHFGDCRATLRALATDNVRVQTCITSPPYFGLRDYGMPGQLGLEATPAEYVSAMVDVFRAVRDVLADDGTLWLNLGDSYGAVGGDTYSGFNERWSATGGAGSKQDAALDGVKDRKIKTGLRPKNLLGVPWRVAFALQADGWILRQEIIWHKPNPMPESVTDRCTKAHESLFLLAKSDRYYFDADAIKELASGPAKICGPKNDASRNDSDRTGMVRGDGETRNRRSVWTIPSEPYDGAHFAVFPQSLVAPCVLAGSRVADTVLDPFYGSGTTGQVAQRLGRHFIGCELNRDYETLQLARTAQGALIFQGA